MMIQEDLDEIEKTLKKDETEMAKLGFFVKARLKGLVKRTERLLKEHKKNKNETITAILAMSEAFPVENEEGKQISKEELEKMSLEEVNDIMQNILELLKTCV